MRLRGSQTAWATVLTCAAVALPGIAWYLAGSEQAEWRAGRALTEASQKAKDTVTALAARLGRRLEELRAAEARRPYYHYQNLYHDPEGVAQGVSLVRSPLALGPADRLVRAYFQIDRRDRVTLPTLNEEVPEQRATAHLDAERAMRAGLEKAVADLRPRSQNPEPPVEVQTLAPLAWLQNENANQLYKAYQQNPNVQNLVPQGSTKKSARIEVGPLAWRTVSLGGAPTLVALREVKTPTGALSQGFAVSASVVDESFQGSAVPASFRPGPARAASDVAVGLPGAAWHIRAGGREIEDASARASEIRQGFLSTFLLGVSFAALAGVVVVLLVRQSERLAQQRSQFAAAAAHELRTPLAGIRMYGEMLAEGLGDPQKYREYARRVAVDAERLGRVVGNVLQFTGLERGLVAAPTELGDVAPVVREGVGRVQGVLQGAGAEVSLEVAEPLPPVRFHRESVFQILQNLLDNAEKYTRGCADRTVRVTLAPAPGNAGVVLAVCDRGPGISPRLRQRLFRAFSRGGGPSSPAGLGLGLTLARALARAQGAELTLGDVPGTGAAFLVTFRP